MDGSARTEESRIDVTRLVCYSLQLSKSINQPRLSLPFFILQKFLRIDRRHATCSRRCDRLAVDVILHIAAGEDAGDVGLGAIVGEDCAHSISPSAYTMITWERLFRSVGTVVRFGYPL